MAAAWVWRRVSPAALRRTFKAPTAGLPRALLALLTLLAILLPVQRSQAQVPPARIAVLARGINVVHWFRWPPRNDPAAFDRYLDDAAAAQLKRIGFTYVRLAVGPEEVMQGDHIESGKLQAIVGAVQRLTRAGLGVMVEPHPQRVENWDFEHSAEARRRLLGFWRDLAPALARFSPEMVFPEVVNEPVYQNPAAWDSFQAELLQTIRAALPRHSVVLTGTNWSSIDGLLQVRPVADRNVVYSFHSYEPQLLTLLASWEAGVDAAALSRIPFPITGRAACERAIAGIAHERTAAIARYWCSLEENAATVKANLKRAADWGRSHQVPVVLTEFGASPQLNKPSRLAYLEAMRRGAEELGLGWALWGLDDNLGFGLAAGSYTAATTLPSDLVAALGLSPATGQAR